MNKSIEKILKDRYYLKNEDSWLDISTRVCSIHRPMQKYMDNMDFIASSPTLMNANTNEERKGTLSSCFTMNIEDSIDDIFDAVKDAALVTRSAGGIGYDFSALRGSTESVKGIGGRKSSGPLPFINIFNSVLDGVSQGGARRGAGMAMLDITHPDILNFIKAKDDNISYVRFNFSIRVNNKFYKSLEKTPDKIHKVQNVVDKKWNDLLDDKEKPVTIKQLWDIIIDHAWKRAEPGIFNSDIAYNQCTTTNLSTLVLSNPCAEYTNIPYGSCSLGSINLSHCVTNGNINWKKLEDIIVEAVRFIDNTFEINDFPLDKIKETTLKIRSLGIGIMGLAHMFFKLDIPYNSKEALNLTEDIVTYITLRGMKESVELAKKLGSYPAYNEDLFFKANYRFFTKEYKRINITQLYHDIKKYGIRNSTITSIAPTGTISTIAESSSGIEPVFALSYMRKVEQSKNKYDIMYITDPVFENYLYKYYDEATIESILLYVSEHNGSCQGCEFITIGDQKIFITAGDLKSIEHLDMLEKVAVNVSTSVSKTINMPTSATRKDVSEVYLEAHKRGVIGVTVYRNGSREGILVHNLEEDEKDNHAAKRPEKLPCHIYRLNYKKEKWIAFVGINKGKPYEVFAGKIGLSSLPSSITEGITIKVKRKTESNIYQFMSNNEILIEDISKVFHNGVEEALTRQISLGLRHHIPINYIVGQLEQSYGTIADYNKVITKVFKKYLKDGVPSGVNCPNCGEKLVFQGGCKECRNPDCLAQFC